MDAYKKTLVFTACAALLSGCVGLGKKNDPADSTDDVINKNIELAIASIQKTQAELYQYGAINEKAVGITGGIYHDNVRIDMDWNGDAYELLAQMAKQRSFTFRSSGSKLPLPVILKVSRAEYKDVMDNIQTQIGYRAAIIVDNTSRTMTLNYNTPNVQESSSARVIRTGYVSPVVTVAPRPSVVSSTIPPTRNGSGFLNEGGSTTPSGVDANKAGGKCTEKGVLSRDNRGKALSCTNGRWKIL